MKKNPFNSGKSKKNGGDNNWVYALLCIGVIAFIGRIYSKSSEPEKTSTNTVVATNKPVAIPPRPIVISFPPAPPKQTAPAVPPPAQTTDTTPRPLALAPSNAPVQTAPLIPLPTPPPPIITPSVAPILAAQIELARLGYSSGSIDGKFGLQTRSALIAFQKDQDLRPTGDLDTATKAALFTADPALTQYTITAEDLARLHPTPKGWVEKSELPKLDYENILELLGEKSMSHPQLIRDLNPSVNWNQVTAGTRVNIPAVVYPLIDTKAAFVRISLGNRLLEAFDAETNLLVHFPCSIGHIAEKRPVGELRIDVIIFDPNYTFNPAVFPESPEAQAIGRKLIIPPGPNNPVGMAWIGLNRPGYGMHGTPGPEQVGRTESHGCFRLANWNAVYLAHLTSVGTPVFVEP